MVFWSSSKVTTPSPKILSSKAAKDIAKIVNDANLTDDAFVKISRQLDFWFTEGLPEEELIDLAQRLVKGTAVSTPTDECNFQCPKVRYGKTEVMMPIVTTGGMRIQWTWMPDIKPLNIVHPSNSKILGSL